MFLFVGPTGTGKTEIAKAFSAFVFGSEDRLVRLDMSEYQTPESLDRLLGDATTQEQAAPLIAQVRKQPFSVLLLDEFEKAHPQIWDIFLQVFDDGRLTDRSGRTVDLRHCVIILTSNLGSAIPTGPGVGVRRQVRRVPGRYVLKSVDRSFRPEFLNRLDRVVVFRPLGRDVMRGLLEKELNDVLDRRGFRMRPWAVEWDEAAVDYLIEQGFSAELGARPLKRAVERHLLTRIATAIVERQFPAGDQFLFVTAREGTGLDVAFVDPDAAEQAPTVAPAGRDRGLTVAGVALEPEGTEAEAAYLRAELASLAERVRTVGRAEAGCTGGSTRARVLAIRRTARRCWAWSSTSIVSARRPRRRSVSARDCPPDGEAHSRELVSCSPAPPRAFGRARRPRRARGERRDRHSPRGSCGRHRGLPAGSCRNWRTCTSAGRMAGGCASAGTAWRTPWSSRSPGSARTRCSSRRTGCTCSSCRTARTAGSIA